MARQEGHVRRRDHRLGIIQLAGDKRRHDRTERHDQEPWHGWSLWLKNSAAQLQAGLEQFGAETMAIERQAEHGGS